ncbi:MAG: CocE/NonD family hydrolase [Gemmatimonadales bacterium]
MRFPAVLAAGALLLGSAGHLSAQDTQERQQYVQDNYIKKEYRITMRDGVRLFTAVYMPKDTSQTYPILLRRTPYTVGPYGEDQVPPGIGPAMAYAAEGYIVVYQDVRGTFMSEGTFRNMTPHVAEKTSDSDVDESTDAYDTIEWLLENIPNHNGRVGMWGISYPGFYASASMIDAHPALKAVSPQAPIADWWYDDFHHQGAFFLPHAFGFLAVFGGARPEPTTQWGQHTPWGFRFPYGTRDGYQFYLEMGPLSNVSQEYYQGKIAYWDSIAAHPSYDAFWQARNILPHLKNVAPAVMTVGGWYDAEDLYGALNTYRAIEEQNPGVVNMIVMGPWVHGGWNRGTGGAVGNVTFPDEPSVYFRRNIQLPFFDYYLKDKGEPELPEAYVYETGVNQWRQFDDWPPSEVETKELYLRPDGRLAHSPPTATRDAWDEYVSDPAHPVPYTQDIANGMTREYMTDDQRFASRRSDVLVYQTEVLEENVTLAGPVIADLWVSTSGTASDWIVKLIDVFPGDAEDHDDLPRGMHMSGYQMMVRSEAIRGRFRNSHEHPEPFKPNNPTKVRLPLQDVLHTFQKGHRIMIQIQSTWFPLVDRNPHNYVENIYSDATEADFVKATQRVYRSPELASKLEFTVLPAEGSQ